MDNDFNNSVMYPAINAQVVCERFILQETGTYETPYMRPYMLHADQKAVGEFINILDSNRDKLHISANNPTDNSIISRHTVSNMLTNPLIMPTSNPTNPVKIAGGWSNKRFRFLIQFLVQDSDPVDSKYRIYVQGFTDYNGASLQTQQLDPNMTFFTNNVLISIIVKQRTPIGIQEIERILHRDHILSVSPTIGLTDSVSPFAVNRPDHTLYTMKPEDVFLENVKYGEADSIFHNLSSQINPGHSKLSAIKYDSAYDYLALILDSYVRAKLQLSMDVSYTTVHSGLLFDKATEYLSSTSGADNIATNRFARILQNRTPTGAFDHFTMRDLLLLDSDIDKKAIVSFVSVAERHTLHTAGTSEDWNRADVVTERVNFLANELSQLMFHYMIRNATIAASNMDGVGIQVTMPQAASIIKSNQTLLMFQAFIKEVQDVLLPNLTYKNQIPFELYVESNLFGDTNISISWDNEPEVRYTIPSFSSSLLSPIITNDKNIQQSIHDGFSSLFEDVYGVVSANAYDATIYSPEKISSSF